MGLATTLRSIVSEDLAPSEAPEEVIDDTPEEELVEEEVTEDAEDEEAPAEPEEAAEEAVDEEEPPAEEPAAAEDLVEFDWFGFNYDEPIPEKLAAGLKKHLDRGYTQKMQKSSEELRAKTAEIESAAEQIRKAQEQVRQERDLMQRTLDANPQFHDHWKSIKAGRDASNEVTQLKEQFSQWQRQQMEQAELKRIEGELSQLATQYKVPEGAPLTQDDVRDKALQLAAYDGLTLDFAYVRAHEDVMSRLKRSGFSEKKKEVLSKKVKAKNRLPGTKAKKATTSKKTAPAKPERRKNTLDGVRAFLKDL